MNPANGYFSRDGVPYHSVESLIAEAPDHGHQTTSESYSYWLWLEIMHARVSGDWAPFNAAWQKMERFAIPSQDQQPTAGSYNPNSPATYAGEFETPEQYPAQLDSGVPVGRDPVSPELTAAYGPYVYGMHWLFDCDNFYGYGNNGDGVSTPSYINTFQRGEQESVWETIPHPSWENFKWGSDDGTGFMKLFVQETGAPAAQWRYTNAPDADARAVQAVLWGIQFAKDQGRNPADVLPLAKASKMGDFVRLSMFDKYFKPLGTQNKNAPGGTGYDSAHYLISWYYAWGGPLTPQGWAWRIGSSHNHFGYQNPVAAYALSQVPELRPVTPNGARDWSISLGRQLEFYEWLQSADGAIAGGATNSWNGRYEAHPPGTPTFYGMAYVQNPVYADPGSNTWFGFQAWSVERVAELYYLTGDARAKRVLDKWIPWARSVVRLNTDGSFDIPAEIAWTGAPNTWNPASPAPNTNLRVSVVSYGKDLGIAASLAKTFTYYAAATRKHGTLDTTTRDLAREILDRMWTKHYNPTGKGVSVEETRGDFKRFLSQVVHVPAGWTGKMPNGDVIKSGVTFIEIRKKYYDDPDWDALQQALTTGTDYKKAYHRFWAQTEIALANAEYGRLFEAGTTPPPVVPVTGVTVAPAEVSLNIGGTTTLDETVAPANATNKTVTWSSSAPAIASVSASGVVTGVSNGTATITARTQDGGFTATSRVTVSSAVVPVSGITVSPGLVSVNVGATTRLSASIAPENATNQNVNWSSANNDIATVSASGVVTGVRPGLVTITARTQDGGFTASAVVTVQPSTIAVTGVTVAPGSVTVNVGTPVTLTASVTPENATNKTVTWSSANNAIATVSGTGVVTGVAPGSTTVTVRTQDGGFTATASVTVSSPPTGGVIRVTDASITPNPLRITVGTTGQLTANILPANASDKTVTWSIYEPHIATIDQNGLVTGVGVGTTTVAISTRDGGLYRTASVQVGRAVTSPGEPVAITAPFAKTGAGEFYWVVNAASGMYVNSWNLHLLEINGVSYLNRWSNQLPAPINGKYYIRYIGDFGWSHFEIKGTP
jgi:uncharacterized protein YjdB